MSAAARLDIVAVEPYFGGSHRAFLEGFQRHTSHRVHLIVLPARKWKWRMRGAALHVAKELDGHKGRIDLLFASDFLNLADLVALRPRRLLDVPKVVYFHENQLTYPVLREDQRDYQFAFTNITTGLVADRLFFNSDFHRQSFLEAVPTFLKRMPDCVPTGIDEALAKKSEVLPLGCDLARLDVEAPPRAPDAPPLIVWNHRWEFDKDPGLFFNVLFELHDEGLHFEVAVVGEQFRYRPAIFNRAKEYLKERLVHFGFLPEQRDYAALLHRADLVVSTAIHEFFGISTVEAMYCGCYPLLPDRLAYPELIPEEHQATHLYRTTAELKRKLRAAITDIRATREVSLRPAAARFDWSQLIPLYDEKLSAAARRKQ